jgi:hypothetical protein
MKERKGRLELSKKEFTKRALIEPNVSECFGLYDLISDATVRRWEHQRSKRMLEGHLKVVSEEERERERSILSYH